MFDTAGNWAVKKRSLHMLIAHLSDSHLRPRGHRYRNIVDSNAMFLAAIQHLASLDPQPNLIILSGDFVDTGIEAEYALAAEMLASIPQTILMIPGNHDDRERFGLASAITLTLPVQGLCISPLVAKPSFVCIRLN